MDKEILCFWCGSPSGRQIGSDAPAVIIPEGWVAWTIWEGRAVTIHFFCSDEHMLLWRHEETAFNALWHPGM